MTFPNYPDYKDSRVEWLGDIPAHWHIKKFRYVFEESPEKITDEVVGDMLSVSGYRGIEVKQYNDEGRRRTDDELFGYRVVRIGQLVVNTMWLNYAGLGVSEYEGHVSPAYRSYWIDAEIDKRFIHHLMRSGTYVQGYTRLLTGIRPNSLQMSRDDLMVFPVLLPAKPEQTQIARFLDHETVRIDALIEEQQRLIELLKENRLALISRAVTKGLDPTVSMKDSGVEWLGEVPAHWDVARVKNVAKLESGHTPSKDFPEYWEGGDIPWVSLNDSKKLKIVDYIEETQFMITELGVSNSSARLLPARAVVFTRDASIGLAAITTKKMCVSQHLIAWICNESLVLPEYLLLVFYAMEQELDRFTFGATIKTIGMPDIRKLVTTVPPLIEQTQIVADLNVKRELIERLIQESNTALTLHSERRSALISAAVTGKIDVRGWQPPASAPIPELVQEAV